MTYKVKYKLANSKKFEEIVNVKGDGILQETKARFFILDDETRVEIPYEGTIFIFSNERFIMIKQQMEKEAGQKLGGL